MIVCGNDVNDSEGFVFIAHDPDEIESLNILCLNPAFLFEFFRGDVIIRSRAGERKAISKLCGNLVQVFSDPSVKVIFNDLFIRFFLGISGEYSLVKKVTISKMRYFIIFLTNIPLSIYE